MRHGVIHLKPLFNQPAASEAAASAGVKSCSECRVQRVSWGCLVSPSSSQRRFGRGLRAWTQPVMPLSICALWELTPSWDLLPDGWCSHCKQLNITAEASATFSLSPAKKMENETDPNRHKMRLCCVFTELVCWTSELISSRIHLPPAAELSWDLCSQTSVHTADLSVAYNLISVFFQTHVLMADACRCDPVT